MFYENLIQNVFFAGWYNERMNVCPFTFYNNRHFTIGGFDCVNGGMIFIKF